MDEERKLIDARILKDHIYNQLDDCQDVIDIIDNEEPVKAYTKEDLNLLMKDLKEMADISPNIDECYGIKIATEVVTRFFGLDVTE